MVINPDDEFGKSSRSRFGSLDYEVNWSKVRGAMLKFAKETDAIKGGEESPNADIFYTNFIQWMQPKTSGRMAVWVGTHNLEDDVKEKAREFFKKSDEFRELVLDKYEKIEDKSNGTNSNTESEGGEGDDQVGEVGGDKEIKEEDKAEGDDSDGDDSGDVDGSSGNSTDSQPGIGDYAKEYGTTRKERIEFGGGKDRGYKVIKPILNKKGHSNDNLGAAKEDLDDLRNEILLGNVYDVIDRIPTNSVDAVVTSPPYWNLRDYEGADNAIIGGDTSCDHKWVDDMCPKCGAWKGQLGAEPTPEMFIDHLVTLMEKIRRILKPTGGLWLNIGDTYAGKDHDDSFGARRKSAVMVPERLFARMVSHGWVVRNKTVWAKQVMDKDKNVQGATNPGSWEDRLNDTWEPMWFFTPEPNYYVDLFNVRREHKTEGPDEEELKERYKGKYGSDKIDDENINSPTARMARDGYTPSLRHDDGALPPDVWRLPTGSTELSHTAVFSEELPKWPIQMSAPEKVCPKCLAPYKRVTEDGKTVGWETTCNHDIAEEPKSGIVFEPFIGRGTTAKVASDLGRDYIGVEISEEYMEFAEDFVPNDKQIGITDFA